MALVVGLVKVTSESDGNPPPFVPDFVQPEGAEKVRLVRPAPLKACEIIVVVDGIVTSCKLVQLANASVSSFCTLLHVIDERLAQPLNARIPTTVTPEGNIRLSIPVCMNAELGIVLKLAGIFNSPLILVQLKNALLFRVVILGGKIRCIESTLVVLFLIA